MNRALWHFWTGTWLTAAALAAGLHLWWAPQSAKQPPRPPFYFSKEFFLGFDEPGESVPHYLWRFGLFGFDRKLRDADLVVIGTSHVWFGFSASLMTQKLSALAGHPVHVVNMGLGGADVACQARILKYRGIKDQTVLVDLFAPHGDLNSPWGDEAERVDWLQAYVHVLRIWVNGIREWCLDPWLPNLRLYQNHLVVLRMIEGVFVNRWDTGDTEYMWNPGLGYTFKRGVPPLADMNMPFDPAAPAYPGGVDPRVQLPPVLRTVIEANHLRPLLTLIPYLGYQPERAQLIANQTGYPLIVVSPDGLTFRDADHLNAPGRDLASARLADGVAKQLGLKAAKSKGP
jgi:hypothetical protein